MVLVLAGCETPPPSPTVLVCREGVNCAQQPRGTVTYDAAQAVPDRDPEGRIAALEVLAKEDPTAAYDLALRLFRGDGFPRDSYQALQWMRSAAERGDQRAQLALGRLYMSGLEEMGQDLNEADVWLGLAAGRGNAEAKRLLAEVTQAREDDAYLRRRIAVWQQATRNDWYNGWTYRWSWNGRNRRWQY